MTDPTEAIRKAHAAFCAFPSGQTIDALTAECTPSTIRALLDRLDSAERDAKLYRELKPRMIGADFDWNESGTCVLVFEWAENVPIGADLDRNIEALRVGAVGGEG
jgi:hypothetical protein